MALNRPEHDARRARPSTWNPLAKGFHWAMALGLLGNGLLGLSMVRHREEMLSGQLDAKAFGMPVFDAYQLHKSIGIVMLLLVVIRFASSLMWPGPVLPLSMPAWERVAAKAAHGALYSLMFLLPLTGWFMVSASPLGIPTLIFGVIDLPHLTAPDAAVEAFSKGLHIAAGAALATIVVLHVAAALQHHFFAHDDVLRRMMPFGARKPPLSDIPDGENSEPGEELGGGI